MKRVLVTGYWLLVTLLFFPAGVQAAIVPDCNPVPGYADSCGVGHLKQLLISLYDWMMGAAALVALLFIVVGGIRMLYWSFMEDAPGELKSAKLTVTRAIAGLLLVLVSYVIVWTVITLLGGCSDQTQLWCQWFG